MQKLARNAVLAVLASAGFCSFAETGMKMEGTVMHFTVEGTDTLQWAEKFPTEATALVKDGTGTLELSADNSSFTGPADIEAGTVLLLHRYALGNTTVASQATDGAITVKATAQLALKFANPGQFSPFCNKRLVLNGTGPSSSGALRVESTSSWANQDQDLGYVELGSDALIVSKDTCRHGPKKLSLNGYELTLTVENSSGSMIFNQPTVVNGGTVHLKGLALTLQNVTFAAEATEGKWLFEKCTLSVYSGNNQVIWPIQTIVGSSTLKVNGTWTTAGRNRLTVPIQNDTGLSFTGNNTTSAHSVMLLGKISGAGAIGVSGGTTDVFFANDENDFTGTVTVSDGYAKFLSAGTLPGYATANRIVMQYAAARVGFVLGEGGWTAQEFTDAAAAVDTSKNVNTKVVALTDEGVTATDSLDCATDHLSHDGAGTFVFSGATVPGLRLSNLAGTFKLTGGVSRYCRYINVLGGTLLLDDSGLIRDASATDASSWGFWVVGESGKAAASPATLTLTGASGLSCNPAASYGRLRVGETASQGALVEVKDGAGLTNQLAVGSNSANMRGAIHQYGGRVFDADSSGNRSYFGKGADSFGYYGLLDGALGDKGYVNFGNGAGSVGVLDMLGGTFSCSDVAPRVGCGGWGEMYLAGGSVSFGPGFYLGALDNAAAEGDTTAILTTAGDVDIKMTWGGNCDFYLAQRPRDCTAVLNLNGGKLTANKIVKDAKYAADRQATSRAYVNANGGTFSVLYNSTSGIFGTGDTAVDRVTIFDGGLTIDTQNTGTQSSDTPFVAPTGRGVASIALPANFANDNYLGAPEIRISGGGGEGATAHALYDPLTRSVTNILVTCSGWDYETAPKATICSYDRSVTNECVVTLTEGDQIGGGLVKTGGNTLTLNAVNTYRGDTVLKGGTLKFGVAGSLPADSTVVFVNGDYTFGAGVAAPRKFAVDCASVQASGTAASTWSSVAFGEGTTLEIRNADKLAAGTKRLELLNLKAGKTGTPNLIGFDATKYRVYFSGNILKISERTGLLMIVR